MGRPAWSGGADQLTLYPVLGSALLLPTLFPHRLFVSQPASKSLNKVTLTKDFRRVAKTIIKNTESNFYRPDLTKGRPHEDSHASRDARGLSSLFSLLLSSLLTD